MAESDRDTIIGDDSLENWEILGSGGFGLVLKATHKLLGIGVAIKLLNCDDSSGTSSAALCREAGHMEAVEQQFVPRVYGMYRGRPPIVMDNNEMQGMVMELMEGGCLESFLLKKTQSKPPPWPLAFRLVHQVALAMDFIHKKDLVHMDLKPANILLDADLNAKIADFGLTTVSNSVMSTNHTNKGGTLFYIPPEGFGDSYRRVRSYDVYSYGILLWTILTGQRPYPGMDRDRSLLEFRVTHKGQRPDVGQIDVQKAAGLDELVELMQRCWDSDPNKRPSFAECVEVTRDVFSRHEEGISAACDLLKPPPPPPPPPPPRPALGSTERDAFLKHSFPLSFDPNTAQEYLLLSENNRKVTHTDEEQDYADHPLRFTWYPNVLSRECTSDPLYYEVEWRGEYVIIAVCQDDVSRKDEDLSLFGSSPQSWMFLYADEEECYAFSHNDILTETEHVPSTGGTYRVGVYVDPPAGVLCFYEVSGNTMRLLHTERTTFTRPLHVGLSVFNSTAEVCEIW